MGLRRILVGVLLFSLGCQKQPGSHKSYVIGVSRSAPAALVAVALNRGHFEHEGLTVRLQAYDAGRTALNDMIEKKIDFAVSAETPIVQAILRGERPLILATIGSWDNSSAIIARKDRGVLRPADLRGKRIGVMRYTSADYFLDQFLAAHGIARDHVKTDYLSPPDLLKALEDGQLDAVATWRPHTNELVKKLGQTAIVFNGAAFYTESMHLAARADFVHANPAITRALLRALLSAQEDDAGQRDVAAVAKTLHLDPTQFDDAATNLHLGVTLDQQLVSLLDEEAHWVHDKYHLGGLRLPDFLNYLYWDGLGKIAPEAVTIIRTDSP